MTTSKIVRIACLLAACSYVPSTHSSVILKLERAPVTWRAVARSGLGPTSRGSHSVDLSGAARESVLLTSSQVLLVPGPHFGNYCMRHLVWSSGQPVNLILL